MSTIAHEGMEENKYGEIIDDLATYMELNQNERKELQNAKVNVMHSVVASLKKTKHSVLHKRSERGTVYHINPVRKKPCKQ